MGSRTGIFKTSNSTDLGIFSDSSIFGVILLFLLLSYLFATCFNSKRMSLWLLWKWTLLLRIARCFMVQLNYTLRKCRTLIFSSNTEVELKLFLGSCCFLSRDLSLHNFKCAIFSILSLKFQEILCFKHETAITVFQGHDRSLRT